MSRPDGPTATAAPVPGLVAALADALRQRGARIATAESCTGGLIAGACTDLAGSSDWFDRGVVSYSNAAKTDLLGVDAALIEAQGAVSEAVARAMAAGALVRSQAVAAVAVTGVAGPGGGSAAKPVGTVWLGWAWRDAAGALQIEAQRQRFGGDRAAVRQATVACALQGLLDRVDGFGAIGCHGRPPAGA
jgi:nicotinamide-nucleotide amidase